MGVGLAVFVLYMLQHQHQGSSVAGPARSRAGHPAPQRRLPEHPARERVVHLAGGAATQYASAGTPAFFCVPTRPRRRVKLKWLTALGAVDLGWVC
mmetsp:Transcript_26919/g.59590  ORF Transcript_26919/g.59590 Transcript_26919/m.59590 type:complete len:96 (+) Transcript_26919:69-356(+)